jgi:hypothetical protein
MSRKLNLDDLKVQSFVTTLSAAEASKAVGGSGTHYEGGGCSNQSDCCEGSYYPCTTSTGDCGSAYGATIPECGGCAPTDANCGTEPSGGCPTTGYYQCASDPNFGCSITAC